MQMNSVLYKTDRKAGLSLMVSSVLVVLLVGSVYISQLIFQEIAKSFSIEVLDARFIFSLSCFFYAISFFIYGPLSDRVATRRLVTFGCNGTVLCLGLSVITHSYYLYLLVMALSGFFAAAVPAALFAYTAKNTPDEKLPQSMGLLISASIVGIIFSRSFVALLTDYFSWQVAFVIYALMIVAIMLLSLFSLNGEANKVHSQLSLTETYISAIRLLNNKAVFMFLLVGFLLFFVYLGISSFLTFYLKGAPFYLSATMLGWMNFAGLSAVVGATFGAKLISVLGKKNILILFLLGVILSVVIIGYSPYLAGIAAGLFTLFIFVFGIQPIIISVLNQIVDVKSRGAVSSLYLLSCLMGGSAGTWGLGFLWENVSWGGMIIACIFIGLSNVILVLFANRLIK